MSTPEEPAQADPAPLVDASPSAPAPRRPLGAKRASWIFTAYVGTQLVVGILVGFSAGIFYAALHGFGGGGSVKDLERLVFIPAALLAMLAGGFVVLHMARPGFSGASEGETLAAIGWRGVSTRQVVSAGLLGILLVLGYLTVFSRIFPPPGPAKWGPMVRAISGGGWPLYLWALVALVVAPLVEEFVFRGVLFEGFSRSWGALPAAIVVTVLFVAMHVTEAWAYPPALAAIAILGILTTVVRVRSQSLVPAIALHACYNLGIVLASMASAAAHRS